MERRIKLTDDDLELIADALENARDSAIDTKRDLPPEERDLQQEYIEQAARLEGEFRDRIDPAELTSTKVTQAVLDGTIQQDNQPTPTLHSEMTIDQLLARTKHKYTVIDPQGVYSNQIMTVPFEIDVSKQSQTTVLAGLATLKAIAIARMYGFPLEDADEGHVRDMFESVYVEGLEDRPVNHDGFPATNG